jgi:peptidylprolyl isomerase
MKKLSIAIGLLALFAGAPAAAQKKPDDGKAAATASASKKMEQAEKKAAKEAQKSKAAPTSPYSVAEASPASDWRAAPLENLLVLDMPAGPVVIEMRPDLAPAHVKQIKTLVKRRFYDGLAFHRVIEGFVAQGGDPKGDGTGGSDLPDIKGEFSRDAKDVKGFVELGRDRIVSRVGFVDGMPFGAEPESLRAVRADRRVQAWALHCPGVLSMARASSLDSANSQFFVLLGDARSSLDQRYTVWGMILDGAENGRRIERGEPPKRPTPIVRARLAADLPENERPRIEVMRTDSESFRKYVDALGAIKDGYIKDVCDIQAPRKINGKLEI